MAKSLKDEAFIDSILERIDASTHEIRGEMTAMRQDISAITVLTAKQQGILETHIRRTELAEAAIKQTADAAALARAQLDSRIVPIEAHVAMWGGAGKFLAVSGTIAAIALVLYKIVVIF